MSGVHCVVLCVWGNYVRYTVNDNSVVTKQEKRGRERGGSEPGIGIAL